MSKSLRKRFAKASKKIKKDGGAGALAHKLNVSLIKDAVALVKKFAAGKASRQEAEEAANIFRTHKVVLKTGYNLSSLEIIANSPVYRDLHQACARPDIDVCLELKEFTPHGAACGELVVEVDLLRPYQDSPEAGSFKGKPAKALRPQ